MTLNGRAFDILFAFRGVSGINRTTPIEPFVYTYTPTHITYACLRISARERRHYTLEKKSHSSWQPVNPDQRNCRSKAITFQPVAGHSVNLHDDAVQCELPAA